MNRFGFYEVFVVFVFVLVMLIAVFFWLSMSGNVALMKSQTGETRLRNSLVKEAYTSIHRCSGSQSLSESSVELCRKKGQYVKATYVRQPAFKDCEEKSWGEGDYIIAVRDTESNIYSYWTTIVQTSNLQVCLAELLIVI